RVGDLAASVLRIRAGRQTAKLVVRRQRRRDARPLDGNNPTGGVIGRSCHTAERTMLLDHLVAIVPAAAGLRSLPVDVDRLATLEVIWKADMVKPLISPAGTFAPGLDAACLAPASHIVPDEAIGQSAAMALRDHQMSVVAILPFRAAGVPAGYEIARRVVG